MNKKISTMVFAAVLAVFAFSTLPAYACSGNPKCPHHAEEKAEKKVEKKCKKGCTKPCCKKAKTEKKCTKHNKVKPDHRDNSRYND